MDRHHKQVKMDMMVVRQVDVEVKERWEET